MKHLFLHVGMHKTGTTSIQATFHANLGALSAQGIHYLDTARSHSAIVETGFGAGAAGATPPPAAAAARSRIAAFIERVGAGSIVISGEDMCRMEAAETAALLGFLRPLVDRVSVVCFVRPPRGYLTSGLQQGIRAGVPLARLRRIPPPGYRQQIGKFLDQAALADTILPVHDRRTLTRGCSIATMLEICGAPPELYDRLDLRQENASLTQDGAALLLALAEGGLAGRRAARDTPAEATRRLGVRLANALPGERFAIPPALIEAVLARPAVQADLQWIADRIGRRLDEPSVGNGAEHGADAAGWPKNRLTTLSRPGVAALATLLGEEATRVRRRQPLALGLARLQGRLEGWMASAGGAAVLPRRLLAELGTQLVALGETAAAAAVQPGAGRSRTGSSASA